MINKLLILFLNNKIKIKKTNKNKSIHIIIFFELNILYLIWDISLKALDLFQTSLKD